MSLDDRYSPCAECGAEWNRSHQIWCSSRWSLIEQVPAPPVAPMTPGPAICNRDSATVGGGTRGQQADGLQKSAKDELEGLLQPFLEPTYSFSWLDQTHAIEALRASPPGAADVALALIATRAVPSLDLSRRLAIRSIGERAKTGLAELPC